MFKWKSKYKATNAIFLEDGNGKEGRPFKARFLQAGLVKYDFGVCLLKKETIDKFINTFVECPVIIDHKDDIASSDIVGTIKNIWFSAEDGWFWCDGVITDDKAIKLIEDGYNVSCQYRITEYSENTEGKLHNANPYDKEILDGVFEHLAIVENPRYEDAFIAVNAYIATNKDDIEWITVKGTHIPIRKGQSEEEAIDEFFNEKADTEKESLWYDKIGQHIDNYKIDRAYRKLEKQHEKYEKAAMQSPLTFEKKKADIRPVKIKKNEIPQFENKKELSNWMKAQFEELGSVKIDDTGVDLKLSAGKANREAIKRRSSKEENKAVVAKFKEIVSQAIKKEDRDKDERHIKDQEIYYNKFQIDGEDYEVEIFADKPYGTDKNSYYAGHSASKIRIAPRDTMNVSNDLTHYAKSASYIIPHLEIDFNPNVTINKAVNKYQKVFDYIRKTEGEPMDNETKGLFAALADALKARNEAEDEKDKEKQDPKASNEDVDKRKLIDEIGGILKGKVDEELWRTIIGKAEKIAYDKSEAGTADNSKAKNEEPEPKKNDEPKNEKEAQNRCKNEDDRDYKSLYEELKAKVDQEAANKKAKNTLDETVNKLYSALVPEQKDLYISPEKGLELGKQIYG